MRESDAMSRFANLADKSKAKPVQKVVASEHDTTSYPELSEGKTTHQGPPLSRVGRKAIAAYFSPEMSLAMHICARKNGFNLQELMAEAFNDVLRKYGQSPVGE
jgi:hypothetical protein